MTDPAVQPIVVKALVGRATQVPVALPIVGQAARCTRVLADQDTTALEGRLTIAQADHVTEDPAAPAIRSGLVAGPITARVFADSGGAANAR